MDVLALGLRDSVALVLGIAGAAKLMSLTGFEATLIGLGIAGRRGTVTRVVALGLPLIETGLGALIIAGVGGLAVDIATDALLAAFVSTIAFALVNRLTVRCDCFGPLSGTQFSSRGLARTLALIVAFSIGCALAPVEPSPGPANVSAEIACYAVVLLVAAQASSVLATVQRARSR